MDHDILRGRRQYLDEKKKEFKIRCESFFYEDVLKIALR